MWHCDLMLIFAWCLNSVLVDKSQQGEYDVTDKWHTYIPFELWRWRRLLRVPWTARRSNQSTLKEISSEYSLEVLMLKLQLFAHLMGRADSWEKILILGEIEGRRRMGRQRMRWLDGITKSMDMSLSKLWWCIGKPGKLQSKALQREGHNWVTEVNWTNRGQNW